MLCSPLGEVSRALMNMKTETDNFLQTTWGSREGADADDSQRMKKRPTGESYGDADEKYPAEKYPLYDVTKS